MSTTAVYESRAIKRVRRTRDAIDTIRQAIIDTVADIAPATVRQTYYQLVSAGVIDKTEAEYKNTVRLLGELRRAGEVPFGSIADNTRWMRKPNSFTGIEHLLEDTARLYRRDLWQNQDCYVEVWLEKDALAGVLYEVTARYDVPLMVCRGYPSITYLHSAAEAIAAVGKPAHLYYFGDRDPSGIDIPKKVEAGIREFAPDADVTFTCVAVTEQQIINMHLPTRPTKKTDSRSKNFAGESVEVDAIPPRVLRDLVDHCISSHIDYHALEVVRAAERSEREYLAQLAGGAK
jgi:hypothetical protein